MLASAVGSERHFADKRTRMLPDERPLCAPGQSLFRPLRRSQSGHAGRPFVQRCHRWLLFAKRTLELVEQRLCQV